MEQTARPIGTYLLAAMFACLAVVDVLDAEYLDAGLWASFAAAMLVLGNEATPWREIPVGRRTVGIALLALAVVLFAMRIAADLAS